jgi:hypothetical protein
MASEIDRKLEKATNLVQDILEIEFDPLNEQLLATAIENLDVVRRRIADQERVAMEKAFGTPVVKEY